ncbi:MAG: MBL fold metallo-hydrolase [Thermoplasmata archaeon]
MSKLIFLGTGGGRYVTFHQTRATGGIYLKSDLNIHIDPGPGSLIQLKKAKIDPTKTDLLLVSHAHTDHVSDAAVLIEAMTNGGLIRHGKLICSKSVVEQCSSITSFHKKIIDYLVLENGEKFSKMGIEIEAIKTYHNDPTSIGFKINTKNGIITYISDTYYNTQLHKDITGTRVLILAVTRPLTSSIPYHLNTNDAALIVQESRPELAILTHFGMKFLAENPEFQARYIENKTGVKTVSARDLMTFNIQKEISIS